MKTSGEDPSAHLPGNRLITLGEAETRREGVGEGLGCGEESRAMSTIFGAIQLQNAWAEMQVKPNNCAFVIIGYNLGEGANSGREIES